MRRGLYIRWASVGVAWLLSLQALGFSLQSAGASSCCCARAEQHCGCPVCSHQREVSQAQPSARGCGEPGSPALDPAPRPFLARTFSPLPAPAVAMTASREPPTLPDRGPPEVPTPPPLA